MLAAASYTVERLNECWDRMDRVWAKGRFEGECIGVHGPIVLVTSTSTSVRRLEDQLTRESRRHLFTLSPTCLVPTNERALLELEVLTLLYT